MNSKKYVKIKRVGEFDIFEEPESKTYFGRRIRNGDIIRANSLEDLEYRALNYRDELADFFAKRLKDDGVRD